MSTHDVFIEAVDVPLGPSLSIQCSCGVVLYPGESLVTQLDLDEIIEAAWMHRD